MKHFLLIFFIVLSSLSQAQDYPFLSSSYSKINKFEFSNFLQKKPTLSYLLENGKEASKTYFDSIKKVKTTQFEQLFYADTIENKGIIITKAVSEKEQKERNKKFFKLQKDNEKFKRNLKGSTIEKLDLTDLEGNQYSLESLKGKIIVLNFWFTSCAPCIKEMPDLNKMKEKYQKEDVVFFAITYNKKDLIRPFLERTKLDFIIIPNDQATIDDFQIMFFPTNILINKEGKVEFINETFVSNGIEIIDEKIQKLLKSKP
jgi:thiol-disulfide isomerase/thioredoxin